MEALTLFGAARLLVLAASVRAAERVACLRAAAEAGALAEAVRLDPDSYERPEETLASLMKTAQTDCPSEVHAPPAPAPRPSPPPSHAALDAALELLNASATGAEALADLKRLGVGFHEEARLPPSMSAAFEPSSRRILLPVSAQSASALELSAAIAHEAHHARQTLGFGLAASIEAEVDAFFVHHAVIHELLRSGRARPSDLGASKLDHIYFRAAVQSAREADFVAMIEARYAGERAGILRRFKAQWRWPFGAAAAWAAVFYDSDLLRPYETLAQQRKLINIERWRVLATARLAAARRRQWREKWVDEHRSEFR